MRIVASFYMVFLMYVSMHASGDKLYSDTKNDVVYIDVLKPAKVEFPPHIKRFGIISVAGVDEIQNKALAYQYINNEIARLIKLKIEEVGQFEVHIFTIDNSINENEFSLKQIAKLNKLDAIIIPEINAVEFYYNEHNAIIAKTDASFYLKNGINDSIYDRVGLAPSRNLKTGLAWQKLNKTKVKEAIQNSAEKLANAYVSRIAINWETQERIIYFSGNADFEKAKTHVDNQELDKARVLWENQLSNDDNRLKTRAIINLAVYYELNDNLEEAIRYAEKAYKTYHSYEAKQYYKTLLGRLKDNQYIASKMI